MNLLARYQNRPREALQVIHLARRHVTGWASPRLDGLLAAREAVCRAQLGDPAASTRAMQRALHVFQPDMTADDPDWIAYFNTAELAASRASAAGYLGDPTIAARHMRAELPTASARTRSATRPTTASASANTPSPPATSPPRSTP